MADRLARHLAAGLAALEGGDFTVAIRAFRAAHTLAPGDAAVALAFANAQRLAGQVPEARATLIAFLRSEAEVSVTQGFELGTALLETGAPAEALECFMAVHAERPNDPAVSNALAGATRAVGDPMRAWRWCEQALSRDANTAAFRLTAAQIRHELGDLEGASRWLDRAERLRPSHVPTRVQRAYTILLRDGGASAAGWAAFEARPLPEPATSASAWHGEPLAGQSILVTAEQGVGDQFQFLRFVTRLHDLGASRVMVQCHADAVTLLQANGFQAVARDAAPPATDWHVPMLSLPHRLGFDRELLGQTVPYLRAEPAPLTPAEGRRRLGVVWAGNPAFLGRVTRDLDPALLPALLDVPGVEWIGLQVGAARQLAPAGVRFVSDPRSWLETASILSALDGLVTTDTGIAHLAGALGVRTWVMLQHVPDWRWGLEADRTPWYPSMTLIRQPAPGDWAGVVAATRAALQPPSAP